MAFFPRSSFTGGGSGNVSTTDDLTSLFLVKGDGGTDIASATADDISGIATNSTNSHVRVRSVTNDIVAFELAGATGAIKVDINHNDATDIGTINLASSNGNFINATTGSFKIEVTGNELALDSTSSQYRIGDGAGSNLPAQSDSSGFANLTINPATGAFSRMDSDLIGGQALDGTITTPTVTQDGYAITWNNTNGEYELTPEVGAGNVTTSDTLTGFITKGIGAVDVAAATSDDTSGFSINGANLVTSLRPTTNATVTHQILTSVGGPGALYSFDDDANLVTFSSTSHTMEINATNDSMTLTALSGLNSIIDGSASPFLVQRINGGGDGDTFIDWHQGGTNPGFLDWKLGNRNPIDAFIQAFPNTLYSSEMADDSDLFINVGLSGATDDWLSLLGGAPVRFSASGVGTNTTTRYLSPGNFDSQAPTSPQLYMPRRRGRIERFFIQHGEALGNGNDIVYTVLVDGAVTAPVISVTVASDSTTRVESTAIAFIDNVDAEVSIEITKALSVDISPTDPTGGFLLK